MLDEIVAGALTCRAVYGFWPATPTATTSCCMATRRVVRRRHGSHAAPAGAEGTEAESSLADFVAPAGRGADYLGAFAVTGMAPRRRRGFEAEHDDYNSIMVKALADRLAEAFAECLHAQARRDWGYGADEQLTTDDLIDEKYRGIRPAPAIRPAPTTREKQTLFELLDAEAIGVALTESYAM